MAEHPRPPVQVFAYDDAAGVTAAFNLNLLRHINRELGADFDLSAFAHRAHYDDELGRIEMQWSEILWLAVRRQVELSPHDLHAVQRREDEWHQLHGHEEEYESIS